MSDFERVFGQPTEDEQLRLAVEKLVLSVQVALQQSMHNNCVNQKQLAERLGVSPARVSQILTGDQANLTLKTIAKISHALGEEYELVGSEVLKSHYSEVSKKVESERFGHTVRKREALWRDTTANVNRFPDPMAA